MGEKRDLPQLLLARRLGCEPSEVDAALAGEAHTDELRLAAACAAGEVGALRRFDAEYVALLDAPLRALGLDGGRIDDVKQRVREKLLLPRDDDVPRVLQYAGAGRLVGLVKVTALRTALNDQRQRRRRNATHARAKETTVQRIMAADLGPELQVIDTQHRALIKQAFETAIEALERADRGLLRLHLLERMTIDEIAALHGIHRATAARRLARIRDAISTRAHECLRAAMPSRSHGLASVTRAVDSMLDLSLARVLAPTERSGS
jgi:RNA polymerase sigma-70 factor, ECF subfamily